MLEAFFNNEKSFSVFEYLLLSDDFVYIADIGLNLKLEPRELFKIIDNFDLLDMIEFDTPIRVALDMSNPIVIGICILDELVEKYFMTDMSERIQENGSFQQLLDNVDVSELSVVDFIKLLKKLNK